MSEQKHNSFDEKRSKELKRLKKKSRRMDTIFLIGVLQIASIALCYYLGRTSHDKKE